MACFRHYNKGVHTHIQTQTHTLCDKWSFCLFGFTLLYALSSDSCISQLKDLWLSRDLQQSTPISWNGLSIQYVRLNNVVCEKKRKKEEDIDRAACSQPLLSFVLFNSSSPLHPPTPSHHIMRREGTRNGAPVVMAHLPFNQRLHGDAVSLAFHLPPPSSLPTGWYPCLLH